MNRIYFDYAATTPMDPLVKKAMAPYFSDRFGNPGSLHSFGQEAMAMVDESREKIAKAVNADFREIIFTGSATEANNLALRGIVRAARLFSDGTGRSLAPAASAALDLSAARLPSVDQARAASETFRTKTAEPPYRIIISKIEHDSILETARDLERDGIEVIYLPVNKNGLIDLEKLKKSLNERTILVSIMHANNEIGTIQPIAEIAKIIKQFKNNKEKFFSTYPLFHTDAVQAFQFLNCDVNKLGVDLMTLSAHKIYGPKGIGCLYVKSQNSKFNPPAGGLNPIITGGGQEFGLRSGTENVPAIAGFAKAIELVSNSRELENKRVKQLADYFWEEIKKIEPKAEINGMLNANKLPNILNICFPGQNAQDLLIKLDLNGVAVSSGSACSARATKPSHVLKAIGLSDKKIKSSLRFSLGKFMTKNELNRALKIINRILKKV